MSDRINVDVPRWDQRTFYGRLRHFASVTNPAKIFASPQTLCQSKKLLELYKRGEEPKGTTPKDIYRAQAFYRSAFHPDTGEVQTLIGRMCFQVPGCTVLLGAMLIWYRDLLVAYSSAVSGALGVALGLKFYFAKTAAPALIQRLVPFTAVAAANAINLPLMRLNEMRNGVTVADKDGNELAPSKWAAYKAITETLISRTVLVGPPMVLTPMLMEYLGKKKWFMRNIKWLNIPSQLALTAILFAVMIPTACAVYPQTSSIKVETLRKLEPEAYEKIKKLTNDERVYFNKGL